MNKIQQVRNGGTKAFHPPTVETAYRSDEVVGLVTAGTGGEKAAKRELIFGALVDIWNAQLGFPKKGMVGTLEDLALLRDGPDHGLE